MKLPGLVYFLVTLAICLLLVRPWTLWSILEATGGAALITILALAGSARIVGMFEAAMERLRAVARGELRADESIPAMPGRSGRVAREVAETIERQRESLEREQALSRQIFDGFGEGLLAIDRTKRIVLSNRRFLELFGIEQAEGGAFYYEVLRNAEVLACFDRALAGTHAEGRATIQANGERRQIELRVVPFESSAISAVGLFIDVTRIERLSRIRSEFISDFSHEVRTPLAAMQSAVEALESGFGSAEQRAQLLKIVARQTQRLERLSHDLADLDRIESGEIVLDLERTDIGELVDDVISDFADRAAAAGVWLTAKGDPITAAVDPVRMEQVLTNLIDNALQHAPESNEITIVTRARTESFEISVADQGPGIPPEERERIFNRFYRIGRARDAAGGGAGLGLAIAKHLVLRHRGRIRVDSSEAGSEFVVEIPYDSAR